MMRERFRYVFIGTSGIAAVSAAGGEAMKYGWQYWTFVSLGLAATIVVIIWVTKIARDALKKTADVESGSQKHCSYLGCRGRIETDVLAYFSFGLKLPQK